MTFSPAATVVAAAVVMCAEAEALPEECVKVVAAAVDIWSDVEAMPEECVKEQNKVVVAFALFGAAMAVKYAVQALRCAANSWPAAASSKEAEVQADLSQTVWVVHVAARQPERMITGEVWHVDENCGKLRGARSKMAMRRCYACSFHGA